MSVASFQYIRISTSSSNPSSPSSSSTLRFSATKPNVVSVRNSQADGQLRRPSLATPPLRPPVPPSAPTQTSAPTAPKPPSSASPPPPPPTAPPPPPMATMAAGENVITMEFQRQKAKELQEYFKQKKLDEADQGPFFGFIAKNEISNGRWAMFGFAVGMLTEYATGSDFVDQVKILLSNSGILDLE